MARKDGEGRVAADHGRKAERESKLAGDKRTESKHKSAKDENAHERLIHPDHRAVEVMRKKEPSGDGCPLGREELHGVNLFKRGPLFSLPNRACDSHQTHS